MRILKRPTASHCVCSVPQSTLYQKSTTCGDTSKRHMKSLTTTSHQVQTFISLNSILSIFKYPLLAHTYLLYLMQQKSRKFNKPYIKKEKLPTGSDSCKEQIKSLTARYEKARQKFGKACTVQQRATIASLCVAWTLGEKNDD